MPPFSRCTSTVRPWQTVLLAAILAFPAFPQLRASGAAFARAFLTTLDEIKANSAPTAHELSLGEVPRWEMHEFTASGRSHVSNPFRDAALVGEFVSPSGKTNVVDGFYDGDDFWRLRFAPDEEGLWTFLLRDEGAPAQLRILFDFFSPLPFLSMQPFDGVDVGAVAIAEPGKVYVAYLPKGGTVSLDLTGAPGKFAARWFNPRNGQYGEPFLVSGQSRPQLAAPDNEDWAVLLTRSNQ